jgi:predicted GTPase
MDPFTIAAISFGSRFVIRALHKMGESSPKSSTTSYAPPISSPPAKVITLAGATGSGKSSTINALLGYSVCAVGVEHGTTSTITEVDYLNGYRLRDTPGLMDNTDFSSQVWSTFKDSKLVIYVTTGQLYRPELDLISRIHSSQRIWNLGSGVSNSRKLALYVNKEDVKTCSMDSETRMREILAIKEQVSAWIPADRIVIGSSSPILGGNRESPQIDELKKLVEQHIQLS